MRTLLVMLVSVMILTGCAEGRDGGDRGTTAGDSVASPFADPDVARIHRRMMDTLAPEHGWERARYIRFDWVVDQGEGEPSRRFHRWDRYTGLYRLESPTEDGTMVAIFDVDEPLEGRVWVDGEELVEGEERNELLDRAHAVFINDTYWLLMPYKWGDPGVQAEYLGQETDSAGKSWEVVELSFEEGVGRTPQNVYRAWVEPESGIMKRWYHFRTEGVEPLVADWEGWRRVGPIMLASDRPIEGREMTIRFENPVVSETIPAGAFEPPPGAETSGDAATGAEDTAGVAGR